MSKNKQARIKAFLESRGIQEPPCGFYVGDGWLETVEATLDEMIGAGWDRVLQQVKSKFCGLRIYIGKADREVRDLISAAEELCSRMCEQCGAQHGLKIPMTGIALCPECKDKKKA